MGLSPRLNLAISSFCKTDRWLSVVAKLWMVNWIEPWALSSVREVKCEILFHPHLSGLGKSIFTSRFKRRILLVIWIVACGKCLFKIVNAVNWLATWTCSILIHLCMTWHTMSDRLEMCFQKVARGGEACLNESHLEDGIGSYDISLTQLLKWYIKGRVKFEIWGTQDFRTKSSTCKVTYTVQTSCWEDSSILLEPLETS